MTANANINLFTFWKTKTNMPNFSICKLQYDTLKIICRNVSRSTLSFQKAGDVTHVQTSERNSNGLIQEELLSRVLQNGNVPSVNQWKYIKNCILEKGKRINNINFDAKAIGFCITHKNFDAAKSYLNFIDSQNEKPNLATVGKFMRLYYLCSETSPMFTKIEEANIINMYKDLKKTNNIMAATTAENALHALSVTSEWRECINLLGNIKMSARPSASTYSAIIKAAFQNDECQLGWNLMEEMISIDRLPLPLVYHTWFTKSAEKTDDDAIKDIEKMLDFFAENEIQPSKDVTDHLLKVIQPFSYTGTYTTLTKRGHLQGMKKPLEWIKLNEGDFEHLRSNFIENVLVGKNIFNKTTPDELNRFKGFINSTDKWDIVIDGLNVAYSAGAKQSPVLYAKLLANVVHHFRHKNFRMLVMGRDHMCRWPKEYMDFIKANANVFFAQNLSQDDPFVLYATMASGLGTGFLSRDFMRGHAYLLMDKKLKKLFRRWQRLHQHSLINVDNKGLAHIKYPYPVLPTTQRHESGWYIPYIFQHIPNPPLTLDPPRYWLSIEKKNKT